MIYDYRDEDGYVSLWVGRCNNYNVLNNYLSTVYIDEDIEPHEALKNIFISVNKDRACEEELKNAFDEYYNQFEYDFGLSFDEDLRDGNVLEHFTDDLEVLFDGFSYYDTFINEAKTLHKQFSKCNAAVALYDFKYCGDILESKHKDISLYFLGYVKYKKH